MILDKFIKIKNAILSERYELNFFALFLREDSQNEWDVVASAKWIDNNKYDAIKYISSKIKENLSRDEMTNISKIVTINTMDDELALAIKRYPVVDNYCELSSRVIFGRFVEIAYILVANDVKRFAFDVHPNVVEDIVEKLITTQEKTTIPIQPQRVSNTLENSADQEEVAVLEKETERTELAAKQGAEAYRNLGALAFLDDTQKSLKAYRRATQLDPDNADGWTWLGHLLKRIGELDEAINAYQTVMRLGQEHKNQIEIAKGYCNLGIVYSTRGDLDKSVEFYNKSLEITESLGDKEKMAAVYGNLGNVYQIRGDLDKAIEFYNKALEITESLGHKGNIAAAYGNLGSVYKTRSDLDKALEFYNKALHINESLGLKEGMADNYGNLGIVYRKRGDLDKAIEYYNKALEIDEELGRKEGMAIRYNNLAALYEIRKDYKKAREHWEKSLVLFQALGSPNAKKVQGLLDELPR